VTQLSLFDKHGIICPDEAGQYLDSPYRNLRNLPAQDYLEDEIEPCDCGSTSGLTESFPPVACQPLYSFIEHPPIELVHSRFIRRVGEEVGGVGSVLFEVINEALAPSSVPGTETPGDWPASAGTGTSKNQQWQKDVAREIRLAAPLANSGGSVNLARDAFNGEGTSSVGLESKRSDLSESNWYSRPGGANAKVQYEFQEAEAGSIGPARTFGYVTSQGLAGVPDMGSHLSIASSSSWSKVQVRADIAVSSGFLELGLGATNGNNVYVRIDSSAGLIELFKIGTCMIQSTVCQIGSATYSNPSSCHNVRLRVDRTTLTAGTASVYVDGVAVAGLQAVALDVIPTFDRGFFRGWNGSTPYPANAAKLDNFEVARFCTNTAPPFNCVP
jgi:hypothetical protein